MEQKLLFYFKVLEQNKCIKLDFIQAKAVHN